MSKQLSISVISDSLNAIKTYKHCKEENENMHQARVIISSNNGQILYNEIMKVIACIATNEAYVELIGNAAFDEKYYGKYSNIYQKFSYENNILSIQGQDRNGNQITINIMSI